MLRCQACISPEYQHKELKFHAHWNYQKEGPWFDWVMVRWEEADAVTKQHQLVTQPDNKINYWDHGHEIVNEFCYTPAMVLMFIEFPIKSQGSQGKWYNHVEIFALIWPCQYAHHYSSVFSTNWNLEYKDDEMKTPAYQIVPVDSFVRHCLMILDDFENGATSVQHEIWPKERWGQEFYSFPEN